MNLKIKDIIRCTEGKLLSGDENYECENYTRDTRTVKDGDTYIALKGENTNGNDYWEEALKNGASTIIIDENRLTESEIEKYNNKNIILVENTRKALIQIATEKRNLYKNLKVVGVTGSVGKTSTKDIIANTLSQRYKTLKTQGNMNNNIGLPFTILNLRDHEAAVIEMGMNHLGEISELTRIAKPTLSVITNVGTSHIGNLGSRENILKAKLEILEGMEKPILILNNDNDLLGEYAKTSNIEIHTFGINNKSEATAEEIVKKDNSSEFICKINDESIKLQVPVGGDVFILNSLCASLVGKLLNLTNEEIQKGISSFELTKKRMEITKIKNDIIIINDTYNASLDSMKASLKYLSEINSNRKIAVLGDMFELGEFSEELHREVGKEVVKNKIDILLAIGENSKSIVDEAKKGGLDEIYYFTNQEELVQKIKEVMQKGDTILFKASNGMRLFDVVEKVKEVQL